MRRQRGFTLIELLIVVAIIGIIAAIAIPNLLNAINRGRQKRSMGDMRTIGTTMEEYQIDWNFYPGAGVNSTASGEANAQLAAYVTPTYIKRLPERDGWNRPFWVDILPGGYTVWSDGGESGGGGTLEPLTTNGGPSTQFNDDIIFNDGQFFQWPEGMQVD